MELKIVVCWTRTWIPWQSTIARWARAHLTWDQFIKIIKAQNSTMYPTYKYTHTNASLPAPEHLNFEQLIKVTSGPETPWRGKIPPADAPSHIHLCWNTTLWCLLQTTPPSFVPSEDDCLPSFTLSLALYSKAGRKDTVGGALCSKNQTSELSFWSLLRRARRGGRHTSGHWDEQLAVHSYTHVKNRSHIAQ